MKLGIIIPHFGASDKARHMVYTLLDSIERHEPSWMKSVVICDDASPATDIEMKRFFSPYPVTLLRRKENGGFSKNVNMGLKFLQARGVDKALLLNNDVILTQPLSPVLGYFEHIEGLSIVGIRLWYPDGRLQHGGIETNAAKDIEHLHYGTWDGGGETRFVPIVTGALQFIDIAQVGAYPEEYPLSYEDVALCLRTWRKGGRVLYTNSVSAIHAESQTRGYAVGPREWESLTAFRREDFHYPEVEHQLQLARQCYPHEILRSLLPPQPLVPYQRDIRKLIPNSPAPIRREKWAQARNRLGLKPVGRVAKD